MRKRVSAVAPEAFVSTKILPVIGSTAVNNFSAGQDDGSIKLMEQLFGRIRYRHRNIDELEKHVLFETSPKSNSQPYRQVNIVGHGNHGIIEIGMGQSGFCHSMSDNCITESNESYWYPKLQSLKGRKISRIAFGGCSFAGGSGIHLMSKISKCTKLPIEACTGLLFVHSRGNRATHLSIEKGHKFVYAYDRSYDLSDSTEMRPLEPKLIHGFYNGRKSIVGILGLSVDNIERVTITDSRTSTYKIEMTGSQIKDFAQMINELEIIDIDARPTAIATKKIKLYSSSKSYELIIYNDSIIMDESHKYLTRIGPALKDLLFS